ncbi:MAG TPA: tyrosine-type recombinase/integrase [Terracidiphilus sp.]|nr:tyrosine-type recombinase/integrase [Terracidiphilus sp.]
MSTAPLITIFVRHSEDCKYKGDEFEKRCHCRKHLRWSSNGTQYRRKANTRSWAEAEQVKREIEDQLSGRTPEKPQEPRGLEECITLFLQDKTTQGITHGVLTGYRLEFLRLRTYCETHGVYTIQGVTRELLTGFCATWKILYPSSVTRSKVKGRLSGFFKYCFESQWIARAPQLPRISVDAPETMPLTAAEYDRLLAAVPRAVSKPTEQVRTRALLQLMRWSGLAIRDALTLKRGEIQDDTAKGLYRVVTKRQKTGTHVSVPIPSDVAREILAVPNGDPRYIFWDGKGSAKVFSGKFGERRVKPVFDEAQIPRVCQMVSHRLRDTFAVDLLEKGVPLEEVSKLLGHTSIRTTEKSYAKWVKGRQDRLDSLVVGTWAAPAPAKRRKR